MSLYDRKKVTLKFLHGAHPLFFNMKHYFINFTDFKQLRYNSETFNKSIAFDVGKRFEGHEIFFGHAYVCEVLLIHIGNVDPERKLAYATYSKYTIAVTEFAVTKFIAITY